MLTGRESLIRLVGKRRRTLSPNLSKLIHPQEDIDGCAEPSSSAACGGGSLGKSSTSERVSCPVCGSSIRGTDHSVNSHLDACLTRGGMDRSANSHIDASLSRGTKRKLTQRTLLHFSFGPKSSFNACTGDLNSLNEELKKELDVCSKPSSSGTPGASSVENVAELCHSASTLGAPAESSVDSIGAEDGSEIRSLTTEDAVGCKLVDPVNKAFCSQSAGIRFRDTGSGDDGKPFKVLQTFIVGRKFHENVLVQEGANISVLRDPHNAKDGNAIKVACTDTGCEQILGYLPRELAKYLSPLIDNYCAECKGYVVSLPKHPLDAVPIQLVFQNTISFTGLEPSGCQNLDHMWEQIFRIVEYMNKNPPSMIKYQQNFRLLIEDVMEHHAHLFTEKEKSFLGSFLSLSDDSQRLFIRLYTRKGPWFRMSNISYSEISDPQNAVKELQSAGYLFIFDSSEVQFKYDVKEVLDVLTVFELRAISSLELSKRGLGCARREELVNFLISAYEGGTCPFLPKMVLERTGICVKISPSADMLLWRVQRLFFLNGEQDLSAFLLVDLNLIKFPNYTCNISRPIFQNRNDLLEYEQAIEVAQLVDQSLDENNIEIVMRCITISDAHISTHFSTDSQSSSSAPSATFFSYFSASWVYSKVLTLGVSIFEQEHRYEDAIRLLKGLLSRIPCTSRRGYWTTRLSIDLQHIGCLNESLSVAEEGVLDPWVRAGSKMALQRRVLRLSKPPRRWKTPSYADSVKRKIKEVTIRGRPLSSEIGMKSVFYGYDNELCGVEQLALQYYGGEGGEWHGVHSESGIWMTIFGLLMWDVIFASVPDVFRSRFQTAPLDLNTDDFYAARKSLIESQLRHIQEGLGEEILITSWEAHRGTACQGVNWDRHSLDDLRAVVSCIRGPPLSALCRHLAQDYRSWCSGMPDLLLWRFHGEIKDGGEAKLVEVKGPRDRLSEQQRAWMLVLMDCGFDAEVCKVSPAPISG